ncbi:nitroreductase/quinone reductase family protein [Jongsikchunia kroppenstedtii]|uniref:nitroreductase/quinone reductase family protein n=1 Tax=Jongsikchunia kroppenstedtii TaxID=1121721 RepID=UPI001FE00060|nr:nitroreductase/quinone reductase family protein [Jongsikchunia kroppenstedtii]
MALLVASVIVVAIQLAEVAFGWSGRTTVWSYVAVLAMNIVVTLAFPAGKARVVRFVQRWLINPPVRLLLHLGLMPLGYALLETTGRRSGKPRRTPVGNGRQGSVFWIVAEHGPRAGYVRNITRDPRVRVRMRVGLRFRWVDGIASVHPELDPVALQLRLSRWHPLRAFNAVQVQVLGSSLLVVHVELAGAGEANAKEPVGVSAES